MVGLGEKAHLTPSLRLEESREAFIFLPWRMQLELDSMLSLLSFFVWPEDDTSPVETGAETRDLSLR